MVIQSTGIMAPDGVNRIPKYRLALYNEDALVKNIGTVKIGRIRYLANNRTWTKAHLKVQYWKNGPANFGVYYDLEELKAALSAFTEPELLEYLGIINGTQSSAGS